MLITRVLHGEAGDGALVNQLLDEFHRGFPTHRLCALLRASDADAVSAGVWIAAELGVHGRAVFDDVVPLLEYPRTDVRYFALDYLTNNVGAKDTKALASAVALVGDPEMSVRQAALRFLATVDSTVIEALLASAPVSQNANTEGLWLLTAADEGRDDAAIRVALQGHDPNVRRFAVAAAARRLPNNAELIDLAVHSDDPDVAAFAERFMKRSTHRAVTRRSPTN